MRTCKKIEIHGFAKLNLSFVGGLRYTLYIRDATKLIKGQIEDILLKQIFFHCGKIEAFCNPMNALVETRVCKEAKRADKTSRDLPVSWNLESHEGEQFVIECLESFRDKSQVFVLADAAQ